MQDLSKCVSAILGSLGPEAESVVKISSNNAIYAASVRDLWTTETAVRLILDHTNAFYVRKDDRPRKGPDKDKPYIVCEICMDEPLVRSEMDARKEMMALRLKARGLDFNELRILPARRGMRKRHPFKDL